MLAGRAQALYNGLNREFTLDGAELEGDRAYDEAWYVIGEKVDLVLVNVTAACRKDINRDELREIDWTAKMFKRYPGNTLIQPKFNPKDAKGKLNVVRPGINLPTELEENETVYALIPIPSSDELTEEYLDEMVIDVCY